MVIVAATAGGLVASRRVGPGDVLERSVYLPSKLGPIRNVDGDRDRNDHARHRHSGDRAHPASKGHGAGSRSA